MSPPKSRPDLSLTGTVGVRALSFFNWRFYSPVYGYFQWYRDTDIFTAVCAIGCPECPSDQHAGCGFHSHWSVHESRRFINDIRGLRAVQVLVECFGKITLQEKGVRAQKARVIGVVDWGEEAGVGWLPPTMYCSEYFNIPIFDRITAQSIILHQAAHLLGRRDPVVATIQRSLHPRDYAPLPNA